MGESAARRVFAMETEAGDVGARGMTTATEALPGSVPMAGGAYNEAWSVLSDTIASGGRDKFGVEREPAKESEAVGAPAPRYSRRLSDKILIAFHHACDQSDFEIADNLLRLLELMLTRRPVTPDGNRRRSMESLVAAHERLWHLRHPGDDQF
jgi:hypothetical protein